jgi:HlyB family type I secretion system ABC transporter
MSNGCFRAVREMTSTENSALANCSLLRFVPEAQRSRLESLFQPAQFEFGDYIIRQGDPADAFFVLVSGRARVVKTSEGGQELSLNILRAGAEFGEGALLSGGVRNASVRCSAAVEVLRLDKSDFERLAAEFPEFRTGLELTARWRALHGFLYEFSNFGRLPSAALQKLVENLQPRSFSSGQSILRQGDPAGPMYIVQKGRVRIFVGNNGTMQNRAFLREGDFFGELSVLDGSPRRASAEAMTSCDLLELRPSAVKEMQESFPEFAKLLEERRAQYNVVNEARVPLDFNHESLPADVSVHNKVELAEPGGTESAVKEGDEPFVDEEGRFRKRDRRFWRFPFVAQIDEMDCGAASLAMVCRSFGRKVSLSRIRQLCHTSHDGTSLKAICHAASELGLAARALKISLRNLRHMPLPAIVHWEGNHWMVLYEVREKFVRVADPASSLRKIPRAEFEQKWSGYAALFDYTTQFEKAPETSAGLSWLKPFFVAHRVPLLQATLLAGVASVLQLVIPIFTQVIVDTVIVEQNSNLLQVIIIGMLVTGVFLLLTSLLQQYLLSFVAVRIDTGVLDLLMRQLLSLPMSYFHSRRTGDIQRRLEGALQVRIFMVEHGIGAMLAAVQILGCIILMAVYSVSLLAIFLAVLPAYAALMFFSVKVLRPIFADLEESYGKYASQQIDAVKGIEAVKVAAAELSFRDAMLNEFLTVSKKMFRGNFIAMSYDSAIQLTGLLANAIFLLVGANMVMKGQLSIGSFVAFNALLAMASNSVLRVLTVWDQLQRIVVLMDRLNDIFEPEPEQGRDRGRLQAVPTLEGHIELRKVGFRYGGPESPAILEDINLQIPAGRTVAIVGRSGCGKTTLIKLVAGLIEPTEGTILFDHIDLKRLNYREARRKIGMVLQENYLFSDSILKNIAFGDPEPNFEKVLWAAQLANAHEFILRLPLGYETKVGETGLALSGGQKQRICIARALYQDPPILIFDEATSALDAESERAIQENMDRLISGRTSLIIAHRLSTIRNANFIVVLERGKVAEVGTHDELMARRGLYFYLSSQQMAM